MSEKIVDVAAGLILRPDGKLLLGQRPEGKPWAGWWELPETRNVIAGGGIIEGAHADDTETSLLLHYGYDIPLPRLPFLLPEGADDANPERQDTRAVSESGILASGLHAPSAECGHSSLRVVHIAL